MNSDVREAKRMMGQEMMHGGAMMWGMGLIGLIALVLLVVALVKYLFFR